MNILNFIFGLFIVIKKYNIFLNIWYSASLVNLFISFFLRERSIRIFISTRLYHLWRWLHFFFSFSDLVALCCWLHWLLCLGHYKTKVMRTEVLDKSLIWGNIQFLTSKYNCGCRVFVNVFSSSWGKFFLFLVCGGFLFLMIVEFCHSFPISIEMIVVPVFYSISMSRTWSGYGRIPKLTYSKSLLVEFKTCPWVKAFRFLFALSVSKVQKSLFWPCIFLDVSLLFREKICCVHHPELSETIPYPQ